MVEWKHLDEKIDGIKPGELIYYGTGKGSSCMLFFLKEYRHKKALEKLLKELKENGQ